MYFYHAYALGVGWKINEEPSDRQQQVSGKQPKAAKQQNTGKQPQTIQATCALPITGGVASLKIGKSNFTCNPNPKPKSKPITIALDSVESKVSGEEQEINGTDVYITTASISVKGLKIENVISANLIQATLQSKHRAGDPEPSIVISDVKFDGLRIKGQTVDAHLSHDVLQGYPNYGGLQKDFQNQLSRDRVLRCLSGRNLELQSNDPEHLREAYATYHQQKALPNLKQAVICSLVSKTGELKGIRTYGSIVVVPDFGTIYLGELIIWPWMRCLNMFRVELDGISISGCSAGANGTTIPPTGGGTGTAGG